MKILAIRGKNLASLAEPFAVELTAAPLSDAGLFAITGPTGAGKSTLLDALCLALYDRTPRLEQASRVQVGAADDDQRLASNDPRSILRRGTASGYAEVDFVGVDGQHYRARWEVRRARNNPDGRLQNQTISLHELQTGQALGGSTRTEILALIADKLGLNFDQFRRAVLLAQGEFAAFLRAGSRENAELLERITGTEIYGDLSQAAFERNKTERTALAELERRLADLQPLSVAERQTLLAEQQTHEHAALAADRERREAERICHWHQALARLQQAKQAAAQTLDTAVQTWQAATERRQRLDEAQRALPLKGLVDHFEAAEQAVHAAVSAQTEAEAETATARAAVRHCTTALTQAQNQQAVVQAAAEAVRAELRQARDLDVQLHTQTEQLDRITAQAQSAANTAATAATALTALEQEHQQLQHDLTQHADWLAARPVVAGLAEQWTHWERALSRYAEAAEKRRTAEQALYSLAEQISRQEQKLAAHTAEQQQQQAALHVAQDRYSTCVQTPGADLAELRQAQRRLEAAQQHRQRALTVLREWQDAEHKHQQAATALTACQQQAEQAATTVVEQTHHSATLQAALTEAERAERAALTACTENVTHLRAQLVDGEACPVCGALAHPWAHAAAPLAQLLDKQQERVAELRQQLLAAEQTRATAQSAQQQATSRAAEHQTHMQQLTVVQADLHTRWVVLLAADPSAALPPQPTVAVIAVLDSELATLAERRQQVQAREDAALAQANALNATRTELDRQRALVEQVQTVCEQARQTLNTVRTAQREQQQAQQQAQTQQDHEFAELATPFAAVADWSTTLAADPGGFRQQWAAQVANWRDHSTAHSQLEQALQTLNIRHQRAVAAAEHSATTAAAHEEQRQTQARLLDGLRNERQQCLAGRTVAAVEQEQEQVYRAAAQALEQARDALHTAEQARGRAEQSVSHWRAEAERRHAQKVRAANTRNQALAASGLDAARLPDLFAAFNAAQLAAEQQALAELDRARDEAATRLQLCRDQYQQHAADQPPTLPADAAASALVAAETALTTAQQNLAVIGHRLQQDDERRDYSADLQNQLAGQRARAAVWQTLNELIGSHDGKKFRVFAQSLTLDLLVAHANRHLAELARRYQLQRVPGSDLDLQIVDHEMGDEIRSVHSLSGGESFLVSLALALGLASLSANRTQVESLFIDEGFGSLDADTLDVALASLDALQAQGRQVGVISHVDALKERIGVQVRVERLGGGRSRVRVHSAFGVWPEAG